MAGTLFVWWSLFLLSSFIPLDSCAEQPRNDRVDAAEIRPHCWAEPLSIPGLDNLHRVSPTLYRGAQPTVEGFRGLEELGVKTVVNLEIFHSDKRRLKKAATGLVLEQIRMESWRAEEDEIVRFLLIATDAEKTPVFVHCYHGADRTGTMVAFYRMVVQGWSKDDAIREMKEGGFNFHSIWKNLEAFIREADIERLKKVVINRSGPDQSQ